MENRRSENDEVSGRMWEVVETSPGKIKVGKAEGGESKRRSRKEIRGERQEKKTEKREDDGSKESGRRMRDL